MIDSPDLMLVGMPLYLNFWTDALYTGSPAGLAAAPSAFPLLHPASANTSTASNSAPSRPGCRRDPPFPGCQLITTSSGRDSTFPVVWLR
jgi:hypothetical protein